MNYKLAEVLLNSGISTPFSIVAKYTYCICRSTDVLECDLQFKSFAVCRAAARSCKQKVFYLKAFLLSRMLTIDYIIGARIQRIVSAGHFRNTILSECLKYNTNFT